VVNFIFIYQLYSEIELTSNFAIILVFVTMVKFLFSLLAFNDMGMLVRLIFTCVIATLPFTTYLIIWILFFESLMWILDATIGKPLTGIEEHFSNYIQLFRTSVGDIQKPEFLCTEAEDTEGKCGLNYYIKIWVVFVVEVYFITIVLNNFLIAKISSVYEAF